VEDGDGHPLLVTSRNKHAARLRCRLSKPWHAGRRSFRKSCRHDWREEPRLQASLKTRRPPKPSARVAAHAIPWRGSGTGARTASSSSSWTHGRSRWLALGPCMHGINIDLQPQAMAEASIQVVLYFFTTTQTHHRKKQAA